jgi:hypothetical protein
VGTLIGQTACACAAGFYWSGALASCTACAAGSWSYGGASSPSYGITACSSTCAPGTVFVSSTSGCAPNTTINGPVDSLRLYFSGSQAEGFAAFSTASSTAGITYTTDRLGAASAGSRSSASWPSLELAFKVHADDLDVMLTASAAKMILQPYHAMVLTLRFEDSIPLVVHTKTGP